MPAWKHADVFLQWSYDEKRKVWSCTARGQELQSIGEALDSYGSEGWELVSVVLLFSTRDLEQYRAFFKAPA